MAARQEAPVKQVPETMIPADLMNFRLVNNNLDTLLLLFILHFVKKFINKKDYTLEKFDIFY